MPRLSLLKWKVDGNHIDIEGYGSRIPTSKNWLKVLKDRPNIPIVKDFDAEGSIQNFLRMKAPAIYVPVKDWAGTLVGGYFRSIEGRYHHEDMGSSPFFFSESREKSDTVVLVEGMLDLYSVELWHPSVFGIGSSSLSLFQIDWLRLMYATGWQPVLFFMYDSDPSNQAGLVGANKSINLCSKHGIQAYRVPTPYGEKDPGDLYGDRRLGSVIDQYMRTVS